MASAVVGGIVFRLSIFFLGEVRESGDGPEESRRHVHALGSFPWSSELSASPGAVGEYRFGAGTRNDQAGSIATGPRHRQNGCGFRLASLIDSVFAGKRILSAGR